MSDAMDDTYAEHADELTQHQRWEDEERRERMRHGARNVWRTERMNSKKTEVDDE